LLSVPKEGWKQDTLMLQEALKLLKFSFLNALSKLSRASSQIILTLFEEEMH